VMRTTPPPSSAEVKKELSYTSTHAIGPPGPVTVCPIPLPLPSTEPCAQRSTQPLKVSTRDFFWGKGGRCFWLTTYHPCSVETSRKSGVLTYPEPLGPPRPVARDLYLCVCVCIYIYIYIYN